MSGIGGIPGARPFDFDSTSEPDDRNATGGVVSRLPASPAPGARAAAAAVPVVRTGDSGEAVRALQMNLNAFRARLGASPVAVDGSFGPGTAAAVQQFQTLWGLEPDGVVGAKTWQRLLGQPNPAPALPARGSPEAFVLKHRGAILAASARSGIPPAILAGVIQKESSGRADVVGIAGDLGLMQINPRAHPQFVATRDWRDPVANADYGAAVLRDNLRSFDGDPDRAIAAYNAGAAGVRNGLARGRTLDEITFKPHYVRDIEAFARAYEKYF